MGARGVATVRDDAAARRMAALPVLRGVIDRFLRGETGLEQFTKESSDFAFAEPHWGFKAFGQMHLNQYVKVARGAGVVDEVEGALRDALRAPAGEDDARRALRNVIDLTRRIGDEASRLGVGKPAPGRVPFVVSYFWEAQDRDQWPIAYPASKDALRPHGLYQEAATLPSRT